MEKILFVDDDPNLLEACRRQLRKQFAIETAVDPMSGLAVIEQNGPFAIVVSDLRMAGGMDGIEFLSQVQVRSPDTVRIMLTGYPGLQTAIDAVNQGNIFRFLTKPCSPESLATALNDGLRKYDLIKARYESLEAQLRHAQKLALLGQCGAGAAHDLRNILTAIGLSTELALEGGANHVTFTPLLQEVQACVARAGKLTQQMVTFSRRTEAARFQRIVLDESLANLQGMLRHLLGSKILLEIDCPAGLPPVRTDEDLFSQVIMNFACNARDAMPSGGRLLIRAAAVEDTCIPPAAPSAARPQSFVCISISDTGCGMDSRTQARIFEPFFTTKQPGEGTGLGLANVAEIVRAHQGRIEVESEIGRGTTFKVFLPRWQGDEFEMDAGEA